MTETQTKWDTEANPVAGFATTFEELQAAAIEMRTNRTHSRDSRVCSCGHPVSRHSEAAGRISCAPTRMVCPCGKITPVIKASDTRPFLRKTKGPGHEHALMQGVYGLVEKSRKWEWLETMPTCMKCEKKDVPVVPVAINRFGQVSYEPERVNVMLCEPCLREVQVSGYRGE